MLLTVEEVIYSEHLSLESLRLLYSSCYTCGVSWSDDHVSLDCHECGGYSMVRPCPDCNGNCNSKWLRNLPLSHGRGRAIWEGMCAFKVTSKPANDKVTACITVTSSASNNGAPVSSSSASDAVTNAAASNAACRRQGLITSNAIALL